MLLVGGTTYLREWHVRGGTRPQIFGSGQCFVSSVAELLFGRNPLGITFLCLCLRSFYHYQKEAYFFPFILNVRLMSCTIG